MIPEFLLPESFQKRLAQERKLEEQREKKHIEERLTKCVAWDPKMPWVKELNLKAETFKPLNLFPGIMPRAQPPNPNDVKAGHYAESPGGEWRFLLNRVPRGGKLLTWCGSRIGSVVFDGPVLVPAIYHKELWRRDDEVRYDRNPYMSLTPAEIMSMRAGVKLATGHTVIAGLGLGHLLIEVSKKRSVKKITVIEISKDLVTWIYPRIEPHLAQKVDVIVGDAKTVIPGMEGDVALIDIDDGYGGNEFYSPCQHFNKVWVWGSAKVKEKHVLDY